MYRAMIQLADLVADSVARSFAGMWCCFASGWGCGKLGGGVWKKMEKSQKNDCGKIVTEQVALVTKNALRKF